MEQETVVVDSAITDLNAEVNGTRYPSLVSGTMHELVAFYNAHSGKEPVKRFKNLDAARQAVQQVIAVLEGEVPDGMEEEAEEIHADATSISAQLIAANAEGHKSSTKNAGVWLNVKMLLEQGLTNKEILVKLEELYGNTNTTYACVAWYRNKWRKMVPEVSKGDRLAEFLAKHSLELTAEATAELLVMMK